MSALHPEFIVQIGFSGGIDNAFRISVSELGGTDELIDGFPAYDAYSGTHDDVSSEVRDIQIHRGREDTLQNFQAGRAVVLLKDLDGKYNPENAAGALAGSILPMMPIRIAASHNGGTAELFRGLIESWDARPVPGREFFEAEVVAQDLFSWLAAHRPTLSGAASTTGEAIGRVLDSANFTDPSFRDIDEGDVLPKDSLSIEGEVTSLQIIGDLLNAEQGVFFIDKGGTATYVDRHTVSAQSVAGTISADVRFTSASLDVAQVKNAARVERTGGTVQEYVDGNSAAQYGRRDVGQITSPYLVDDAQAAQLATYIAQKRAVPRKDARAVTLVNKDQASIDAMMAVDLVERWELVSNFGGGTVDAFVQSIEHSIQPGYWETQLIVSPRSGEPFIVGESTVGSDDTVSY